MVASVSDEYDVRFTKTAAEYLEGFRSDRQQIKSKVSLLSEGGAKKARETAER